MGDWIGLVLHHYIWQGRNKIKMAMETCLWLINLVNDFRKHNNKGICSSFGFWNYTATTMLILFFVNREHIQVTLYCNIAGNNKAKAMLISLKEYLRKGYITMNQLLCTLHHWKYLNKQNCFICNYQRTLHLVFNSVGSHVCIWNMCG